MARKPAKVPNGEGWVGERVRFRPRHRNQPELGTIVRMASGKDLAMFVLFDGDSTAKLCYARDLERVK